MWPCFPNKMSSTLPRKSEVSAETCATVPKQCKGGRLGDAPASHPCKTTKAPRTQTTIYSAMVKEGNPRIMTGLKQTKNGVQLLIIDSIVCAKHWHGSQPRMQEVYIKLENYPNYVGNSSNTNWQYWASGKWDGQEVAK